VEKASQVLSQSVATIDRYRKKAGLGESLGKMVRKQVSSAHAQKQANQHNYSRRDWAKASARWCANRSV
jgi:hypothetical protein